MWIATRIGFYSIVESWDPPGKLMVRTRWVKDLENLRTRMAKAGRVGWEKHRTKILQSTEADYPYRIVIGRGQLSGMMAELADIVDYRNFKARIADTPDQEAKHRAYETLWFLLRDAADADARIRELTGQTEDPAG